MITALVQFDLPSPMSEERLAEASLATVPKYQGVPGLHRKYYVSTDDGNTVGGIYLYDSQEAADAVYTNEWRDQVTAVYGAAPTVTFFQTPVVLDNRHGEVLS